MRNLLIALFMLFGVMLPGGSLRAGEELYETCSDAVFAVTVAKASNLFEYKGNHLIEEKYERLKELGSANAELEERKVQELAALKKTKTLDVCEEEDVLDMMDDQPEAIARETQLCLDLKGVKAFMKEVELGGDTLGAYPGGKGIRPLKEKFLKAGERKNKCAALVKAVSALTLESRQKGRFLAGAQ